MGGKWWSVKEPRTSDSDELLIGTYVFDCCVCIQYYIFALIDVKIMSLIDFTVNNKVWCDIGKWVGTKSVWWKIAAHTLNLS